ncbi:hypothetical protein EDL99_03540 [Ornithobacterium rhinotracheale]|uniref:acyltransferase family protein n=1 Tax=Ornithobacterium rhinotracheale TaxID=28251 RepID=UPI00129C9F69|nr:acyltransferase family protein [Ornithobacterium rhinotracheale]MRJ07962.1 hypothetical protein [Ornithobacterium rhinotracheale]UOH78527.1 acyltransferase [Ornithobacterium rhinotracheale]
MDKTLTTKIKGVAILIMLFLHLFNKSKDYISFLKINGEPLFHLLSKYTMICVPFYLILGGYGLYKTYEKNKNNISLKKNFSRVFLLYCNLWIVLAVFVSIGSFIKPEKYPGDISTFLLNFIGLECSYNFEWWFLLPYSILMFFTPIIFKLIDRFKLYFVFFTLILGYAVSFYISIKVKNNINHNQILELLITTISLLSAFTIGAFEAKMNFFSKLNQKINKSIIIPIALIILLVFISVINPKPFALTTLIAWGSFYAWGFLINNLDFKKSILPKIRNYHPIHD